MRFLASKKIVAGFLALFCFSGSVCLAGNLSTINTLAKYDMEKTEGMSSYDSHNIYRIVELINVAVGKVNASIETFNMSGNYILNFAEVQNKINCINRIINECNNSGYKDVFSVIEKYYPILELRPESSKTETFKKICVGFINPDEKKDICECGGKVLISENNSPRSGCTIRRSNVCYFNKPHKNDQLISDLLGLSFGFNFVAAYETILCLSADIIEILNGAIDF